MTRTDCGYSQQQQQQKQVGEKDLVKFIHRCNVGSAFEMSISVWSSSSSGKYMYVHQPEPLSTVSLCVQAAAVWGKGSGWERRKWTLHWWWPLKTCSWCCVGNSNHSRPTWAGFWEFLGTWHRHSDLRLSSTKLWPRPEQNDTSSAWRGLQAWALNRAWKCKKGADISICRLSVIVLSCSVNTLGCTFHGV